MRKGLKIKSRDNAKVVGSSFEREPKVVVFGIGVNGGAVGEDNLIVQDLIADETVARSDVGHSTSSDKAPDAHICYSPSSNTDAHSIECLIDSRPSGACARGDYCLDVITHSADGCHVNGHASTDIGAACLRCMASSADSKFAAGEGVLGNFLTTGSRLLWRHLGGLVDTRYRKV